MAVVWIQIANGNMIHLPILGDVDFNTCHDPIKIRSDVIKNALKSITADRCFSGQYEVKIPGVGRFTLNFDPPGRTGTCNRCGQCCVLTGQPCDALVITGTVGQPGATSCSVHADLLDVCKGCLLFPDLPKHLLLCPNCSFTFAGA